MPFERANPIPPGVYWVDAFNLMKGIARFNAWAKVHEKTVKVIRKEVTKDTGWDWFDEDKHHWWILFEVTAPTPRWENVDNRLSTWPNRAKAPPRPVDKGGKKRPATERDMKKEDTVQRPPEEGVFEHWIKELQGGGIGTAVVIGIIVWQMSKRR